jgi:hypothetical protein
MQSKQLHASNRTVKFESGRVLFRKFAPLLLQPQAELHILPVGRHNDQVDLIVQMLAASYIAVSHWLIPQPVFDGIM